MVVDQHVAAVRRGLARCERGPALTLDDDAMVDLAEHLAEPAIAVRRQVHALVGVGIDRADQIPAGFFPGQFPLRHADRERTVLDRGFGVGLVAEEGRHLFLPGDGLGGVGVEVVAQLAQFGLVVRLIVLAAVGVGIVVLALQPEERADAVTGLLRIGQRFGLIDRLGHAQVFVGAAAFRELGNGATRGRGVAGDEQVFRIGVAAEVMQIEPTCHIQRADFHRFAFLLRLRRELADLLCIEHHGRVALLLHHGTQRGEGCFAHWLERRAAEGCRAW